MARFVTLYSGSSGNASVIEEDGDFILIDIGKSCKATITALKERNLSPDRLKGVLITHEHTDHIGGLEVFSRHVPAPVYSHPHTLEMLRRKGHLSAGIDCRPLETDANHSVGGFNVASFSLSHDTDVCSGYRVTTPAQKTAAYATDLGVVSKTVFERLKDAELVALEANYDADMLRFGRYPAYLKKRIASEVGHLSNEESASVVAELMADGCNKFAFCHLSEENNRPQQVQLALEETLAAYNVEIPDECEVQIARRHTPGDWMHF